MGKDCLPQLPGHWSHKAEKSLTQAQPGTCDSSTSPAYLLEEVDVPVKVGTQTVSDNFIVADVALGYMKVKVT